MPEDPSEAGAQDNDNDVAHSAKCAMRGRASALQSLRQKDLRHLHQGLQLVVVLGTLLPGVPNIMDSSMLGPSADRGQPGVEVGLGGVRRSS